MRAGTERRRLRSGAGMARDAAGCLLVAALFYSPWDYGGTSATAIRNLNLIFSGMVILWAIGSLVRPGSGGRFCPWTLLVAGALLLIMGWGMALNAHAIYDVDYGFFLPVTAPLPTAPGSVDYVLSVASMWRVTALLGCVWVVADLTQDEKWLLRIWWGIALAGASIAFLGLLQKATGAEMTFWEARDPGEPLVKTFFATFYYHGNAGAFLNLALPAVLGLAFRAVTRRANPGARALWIALSLIMAVAVISDTSRMGQFIAVVIVLVLLFLAARRLFQRVRRVELKTLFLALLVGAFTLWAISRVSHLDQSWRRYEQLQKSLFEDARWLVDKAAVSALPEAGPFGFGPGTFSAVFPALNQLDQRAQGDWLFLHNDYLQTLLEWGWVGGFLWAVVFFGGIAMALRSFSDRARAARWFPRRRLLLALAVVALSGVGLHAVVDFPLQISAMQLYAATYLGICWGSAGWGRGVAKEGDRKPNPIR